MTDDNDLKCIGFLFKNASLSGVTTKTIYCCARRCMQRNWVFTANKTKTVVAGSSGGDSSENANRESEKCTRPFGTTVVTESHYPEWFRYPIREYRLIPTVPVLRLLIPQSDCFTVVGHGFTKGAMQGEQELARSGELHAGSNCGKGQMVSIGYWLIPEVLPSATDASAWRIPVTGHLDEATRTALRTD